MKANSTFLAYAIIGLCVLFSSKSIAQQFEVASGPVSNTLSDSRSVNFFDINNDGWEDIYVSNGLNGGQKDLLFLNDGTGQMTQITDMEIVQASNPSDGASFVDYNNDGHIDGVISSWYGSEDLLYLNDGNGSLNYNADAGIAAGSFAETAAFGDYNNDGWLDLYITNSGGSKNNFLYKNLKNGKFERIINHILVSDAKPSRGAIWGDFNNDGLTDLYVANESNNPNDIYYGKGGDTYEKPANTGVLSQRGSMTSSWGDIDNDGDFDLFVGNAAYFSPQKNQLFLNEGGVFDQVSNDPVVNANHCTYGSAFGDFDNDGDLDLMVANGYCNDDLKNVLYENQGDGTFVDASDLLTSNFSFCSFGVAWGDVNNDGFLDLMVANCKNDNNGSQKPNKLLLNLGNDNNWLKIKLIGIQSNTNAIGAKVKVNAIINGQTVWQVREVRSQSGYAGQNSMIVHFGLGDATQVDSIVIDWPAGGKQTIGQTTPNQQLIIEEDFSNASSSFDLKQNLKLEVFPNPANSKSAAINLSIQNSLGNANGKVMLYDSIGQLYLDQKITLQAEQETFAIPLSGVQMSSGIYQLVLQIGEERLVRKVTFY